MLYLVRTSSTNLPLWYMRKWVRRSKNSDHNFSITQTNGSQTKEAVKLDLTVMQLVVHSNRDILNSQCLLCFRHPQTWLLNNKWRNMLNSKTDREKLFGIVVDEGHMAYTTGSLNCSD